LRIFRGSIYLLFLVILIIFCLDNRELVDLKLGLNAVPDKGTILIQLPVFLVVLSAIAIGFILGSLSEFFRGYKFRIDHRKSIKDLSKISSELKEMKSQKKSQKEELLSLIK